MPFSGGETNRADEHSCRHTTYWTVAWIHQSGLASQLGATFHDAQYITCPSTRVSPLQGNEFAFCTKRFETSTTKPVRHNFVIKFSFAFWAAWQQPETRA